MAEFSHSSINELNTIHADGQAILIESIKHYDFKIIQGARTLEKQQEYFKKGYSKIDGINRKSKHQVSEEQPYSLAFDLAPYPTLYSDKKKFKRLAKHIFKATFKLINNGTISHGLVWGGGFWETFEDLPHFELYEL